MTKATTTSDLVTVDDLTNLSLHHEIAGRYFRNLGAALRSGDTDAAAAAADKLAEHFESSSEIYRKVVERRRAMLTLRGWMALVILLVVLIGVVPGGSLAQEAEATQPAGEVVVIDGPTPVVVQPGLQVPDWAWFLGALVLSGIAGGILFVLNKAIDGLKASYPEQSKEMWEKAGEAADRGWTALSEYVRQTPFKYDDLIVNVLDPLVASVIKRLGEQEAQQGVLPAQGADKDQ